MKECVEDRSEFEGLLSSYLWYENVRETVKL